jgi:Protein of unknown function (DUF3455)
LDKITGLPNNAVSIEKMAASEKPIGISPINEESLNRLPQSTKKTAMKLTWAAVIGVSVGFSLFLPWQNSLAEDRGISVPDHTRIVTALQAEGVQIYEAKAQPNGSLAWSLVGPDAKLETLDGQLVGLHSVGPRWKANDGSEVKASKPPVQNWKSPDPKSAAWLLLEVSSEGGSGLFSGVQYVARVSTIGGAAPSEAPTQAGEKKSVPYRAIYLFLAAAGS